MVEDSERSKVLELIKTHPVVCVYHGTCQDGLGAGWVVDSYLHTVKGHKEYIKDVTYVQGVYGVVAPELNNLEGKVLILTDFSYKRNTMRRLAATAKHILVLDHHASAERDLVDLPDNVTVDFRMDESGSTVAWKFFYPDTTVPSLLNYIRDRDLWLFELEGTKEISAALFSYPYSFGTIDMFINAPEVLIVEGEAICRRATADIQSLLPIVTRTMKISGYTVPVANLPLVFTSEAGNILAENQPFAACYWDTATGRVFSLRSVEGGVDVSKIAELFNGGGHKHAAGFKLSYEEAATLEIH